MRIQSFFEYIDRHYKKINILDLSKKLKILHKENFTKNEIEVLEKITKEKKLDISFGILPVRYSVGINKRYPNTSVLSVHLIDNSWSKILSIHKLYDEYFYIVDLKHHYYLCDGIQGIINYIEDNFVTVNKIIESANDYNNKEINFDEFRRKYKNHILFSNNDHKQIIQYLSKKFDSNFVLSTKQGKVYLIEACGKNISILIISLDDEYFVLKVISSKDISHYICDGLNGLMMQIDEVIDLYNL